MRGTPFYEAFFRRPCPRCLLLVIGCAKEPPPTAAESAFEKKDKHENSSEVEGRIR